MERLDLNMLTKSASLSAKFAQAFKELGPFQDDTSHQILATALDTIEKK